jgi:hypothetical protein
MSDTFRIASEAYSPALRFKVKASFVQFALNPDWVEQTPRWVFMSK